MSGRPPKKRVTQDQHAKNEAARKAAEKKARIEAADQAVKHFERQEEIEAENRFVELECQANKYLKDPVAIKYTHLIALFERIKPDGHFLTTEQKAFIKDLYGKVELKHSLREERRRQREKELAADDLEKRRVEERKEVQNLTTKYERLISVIEQLTVASNRTTNKHSAFVCMNLENSRKYLSIERDLKKAKEAFVIKYPLLVTQLTQIEASLSKRKDEFNSAEKKRETREKLAKNANKKDLESRATSTPASDEQAVVTKGRSTDRERWLQAEYLHVQKTLNTAAFASADMTSYGQRAIQGELEKLFPTGPNLSSLIKWYPQIMRENSSNHELRLSYTGKNGHPGSFTVNLAEITLQVVTDLLDALTKAGAAPENMRIDLLSTPSDSRTLRPDESTLVLRTKRPIEDSNHKIKISSDNRDLSNLIFYCRAVQEWSKQKQQQPGKINVSSEIITRAAGVDLRGGDGGGGHDGAQPYPIIKLAAAVRSASAGGAPVSAAVSANGGGSSDSPTYTTNAYKAATQEQWTSKLSTQEVITIQEAIKTLKSEMAESVGNFGKSLKTIKVEALTELLEGCKITNKDNQEKSVGKIIQEIREKPEYKKVRAGIISHRTRDILEALEKKYLPTQLGTAPRT